MLETEDKEITTIKNKQNQTNDEDVHHPETTDHITGECPVGARLRKKTG